MLATHGLGNAMLALAAATMTGGASAPRDSGDAKLEAELQAVAHKQIFFGHQSVGANLIEGLRQLATREGIPLRIAEVSGTLDAAPATFTHGFVAENGNPTLKLENFARALASGPPLGVEVAFVKLCYVDFGPETNVRELFARYQETIARLAASYPRTKFVHVTAPLTTVQGGLKAIVKRLLGRAPHGLVENIRREEYSALLRQAYLGREPLFDLAAVESTSPDGSRDTVPWQGRDVPRLVAAYASDDGHLNPEGQLRAARELVSVLASVPGPRDASDVAERKQ